MKTECIFAGQGGEREDSHEESVYWSLWARQSTRSWNLWSRLAVFFRGIGDGHDLFRQRSLSMFMLRCSSLSVLGPCIWIWYQLLLHTFKASSWSWSAKKMSRSQCQNRIYIMCLIFHLNLTLRCCCCSNSCQYGKLNFCNTCRPDEK